MSTEFAITGYSERDLYIGVPAVEEVSNLKAEERHELTRAMSSYLTEAFLEDELLGVAKNIDGLYSRSSTRSARFSVEDVDVFARSALFALNALGSDRAKTAIDGITHIRNVVGAQQHKQLSPIDFESLGVDIC